MGPWTWRLRHLSRGRRWALAGLCLGATTALLVLYTNGSGLVVQGSVGPDGDPGWSLVDIGFLVQLVPIVNLGLLLGWGACLGCWRQRGAVAVSAMIAAGIWLFPLIRNLVGGSWRGDPSAEQWPIVSQLPLALLLVQVVLTALMSTGALVIGFALTGRGRRRDGYPGRS